MVFSPVAESDAGKPERLCDAAVLGDTEPRLNARAIPRSTTSMYRAVEAEPFEYAGRLHGVEHRSVAHLWRVWTGTRRARRASACSAI